MMNWERRLAQLRERLEREGADALLVSSAAHVRYLTGFAGEGLAVISGEGLLLSTDGRYRQEAKETVAGLEVIFPELGHLAGACERLGQGCANTVAFEAETVTYASYMTLAEKLPGVKLQPARRWVEDLRVIKDDDEVAAMRRAAAMTDQALAGFLAALEEGRTEREMTLDLERELARAGTEPAFDIIMATGESAARPHAVPGERRLARGDMLKIDVGGRCEGYCSDLTRTYYWGDPDAKFAEVYRLVRAAQAAGLAVAGPGVTGRQVDQAAREIIAAGGYGEAFSHGLGHGVGLQVHEGPRVSATSDDILQPGMVVTIEPGVYIEGWGGVRIEDMVLITAEGSEVLTGSPQADY